MKVKPVGRERDRQIAELKGNCYHEYKPRLIGGWAFSNRKCLNCGVIDWKLQYNSHYSISLTDCWPLWEEMKEKLYFIHLYCSKGKTHISLGENAQHVIDPLITLVGEDELDAISGAWVMWMIGGQNDYGKK